MTVYCLEKMKNFLKAFIFMEKDNMLHSRIRWGRVTFHRVTGNENVQPKRACITKFPGRDKHFLSFFILFKLLGWHWSIKQYRFQVYSSIILHLYIVSYVHHPNSSLLPSPLNHPWPSSTAPTPFPSGNHHTASVLFFFLHFISH